MLNKYFKEYFDIKIASITLMILAVVFFISGSTFAFWEWYSTQSQDTSITFTANASVTCSVDGGGDISSSMVQFQPAYCTDSEHVIKRKITYSRTIDASNFVLDYNLYLDVKEIGEGFLNSENFKYAVTSSPTSCDTDVITSGKVIDKAPLINEIFTGSGTDEAYLWIWLDAAERSPSTMNQSFKATLNGTCDKTKPRPSKPVLDSGMIPVTIADNGTVTTVLNRDESWYNYDNKQWSNAVLVTESSRANYLGTTGKPVTEGDILAYYVWIPRYKYKIWTNTTSASGSEKEIEIEFENKLIPKSTSTNVGDYYTHPAFTFGDTELDGIWVGKFEATGNATTPTIKPKVSSLRSQNVSTQFVTALKFAGGTMASDTGIVTFTGNTTYGLTDKMDSHMMKNDEWGAVAYLSRSKYGINEEIRINNNINYTTGCGATTQPTSTTSNGTSTCEIPYGGSTITSGNKYPQSTTGNISGIFDMSGGTWEYVMGNYNKTIGIYAGFSILPEEKYYNNYTTTTSTTACNGGPCYGHALSETHGWYGDYAGFVSPSGSWFGRGGGYGNGSNSGAFNFYVYDGDSYGGVSWRSSVVLVR